MVKKIDVLDRKILHLLQQNAEISLDNIAQQIGSSRTPVWNRIRKLRAAGVIKRTTAELNPQTLGINNCFFVLVRTSSHASGWLEKFTHAIAELPEIVEAHRLAGDIDYILKVYVENAQHYDRFYRQLVDRVEIFNVTSSLSMETLKPFTGFNIPHA